MEYLEEKQVSDFGTAQLSLIWITEKWCNLNILFAN